MWTAYTFDSLSVCVCSCVCVCVYVCVCILYHFIFTQIVSLSAIPVYSSIVVPPHFPVMRPRGHPSVLKRDDWDWQDLGVPNPIMKPPPLQRKHVLLYTHAHTHSPIARSSLKYRSSLVWEEERGRDYYPACPAILRCIPTGHQLLKCAHVKAHLSMKIKSSQANLVSVCVRQCV